MAVVGPRQCGKTTLVKALGKEWEIFDLEKNSDFEQIRRDPDLFFRLHPEKVVIDEAQLLPEMFNALRVAIDDSRDVPGRYIITGSSSPRLTSAISESLAGRVGMIEMAPFSLPEVEAKPLSALAGLIADGADIRDFPGQLKPVHSLSRIHELWLKGGYPEPWCKGSERFHELWMQNYFDTYLLRDLSRHFPGIHQARYRAFLGMLAGLSGTVINYSEMARALEVSHATVRTNMEIAHNTFIWHLLPAFSKDSAKRIVKHPKGYLRDSGLLHYLAHIRQMRQLMQHPYLGRSWEGFVIEEVLRQFNCAGKRVEASYYRTGAGAEVDLVLEGGFGVLPVEIKFGQAVKLRQIRGLMDFMNAFNCNRGLVICNDTRASMVTEKIASIPVQSL